MMDPDLVAIFPLLIVGCAIVTVGWVATTWLRIKNGYPLENQWGKAIYPKTDREAAERVALLTNENAELRAEIGAVKDRLANVERIVIDDSHRLTHEIEALREKRIEQELSK